MASKLQILEVEIFKPLVLDEEKFDIIRREVTKQKYKLFDDYELKNQLWFEKWIFDQNTVFLELGDMNGLFLVNDIYKGAGNVHAIIWSKRYFGKVKLAIDALRWGFKKFKLRKYLAFIPENNRLSLAYTKRIGFREVGYLENEFLSMGKRYNIHIFEFLRK
jgi:RimJ/RimL family protein N-acetyltransferase